MTAALEERFQNLHEFITQARNNLNRNNWDYLDRGAWETETTLPANRAALDAWGFRPRVLRDLSNVDRSRSFFGKSCDIPVLFARPSAGSRWSSLVAAPTRSPRPPASLAIG